MACSAGNLALLHMIRSPAVRNVGMIIQSRHPVVSCYGNMRSTGAQHGCAARVSRCLENADSQTRDYTAHVLRFAPRLPVRQVAMQGQTSLLSRAQRVEQDFDLHLEEGLFLDLAARVKLDIRDW